MNELPKELQQTLFYWFETEGIDAPIMMQNGFIATNENSEPMYILILSHNSEYQNERISDGYNIIISARFNSNKWIVSLVEGTIFETKKNEMHSSGFSGFHYTPWLFADIDGNGVADIILK